jgi:hypothetical protein
LDALDLATPHARHRGTAQSIRFRIYDSPMVIEEAFLPRNKQQNVIIKVAPKRS